MIGLFFILSKSLLNGLELGVNAGRSCLFSSRDSFLMESFPVPYSVITVISNSASRNIFSNLHHNNLNYNIY